MDQEKQRETMPLYDHPERFESLGRRRRLLRMEIDPDQVVSSSGRDEVHHCVLSSSEPVFIA